MNLQTYLAGREHVFSIGIETNSDQHCLSFPVGNRLADYEEYYQTDADDFARYLRDIGSALEFVEHCRRRQVDHLLLVVPGNGRGSALQRRWACTRAGPSPIGVFISTTISRRSPTAGTTASRWSTYASTVQRNARSR